MNTDAENIGEAKFLLRRETTFAYLVISLWRNSTGSRHKGKL